MVLNDKEVEILAHIMDHFTDYMALDDRPDHGFGILKEYRKIDQERKAEIYLLTGRLLRARKRNRNKLR